MKESSLNDSNMSNPFQGLKWQRPLQILFCVPISFSPYNGLWYDLPLYWQPRCSSDTAGLLGLCALGPLQCCSFWLWHPSPLDCYMAHSPVSFKLLLKCTLSTWSKTATSPAGITPSPYSQSTLLCSNVFPTTFYLLIFFIFIIPCYVSQLQCNWEFCFVHWCILNP